MCIPTEYTKELKFSTFQECEDQRLKIPGNIRVHLGLRCIEEKINDTDELVQ